jgi:hypothetical protein
VRFESDFAPNGNSGRPSGPSGPAPHGFPFRLVWSQLVAGRDRQRGLFPTALLCIFLGGVVAGAGGRDAGATPRVFRAAAASLLSTGGVLLVIGGAALLIRKATKSVPKLTLAALAEAGEEPASTRKEDPQ